MTELPDFTGYEPVAMSDLKQGDVVAAVLGGAIAHGEVSYCRPDSVDIGNALSTTAKGDYKFYRAPKQLPTGECAVIEYMSSGATLHRAVLMGSSWFLFNIWNGTGDASTTWDHPDIEFDPNEMQAEAKAGFTVIFEGVKK